ncbi:MAG: ATP-binding protein [Saprospiraceae bacterium]|nr:ATP-binding protein [Saprospiraceae bacterium]MBK8297581.1 ATP-binding protein [Saprospiraceae bacterium]
MSLDDPKVIKLIILTAFLMPVLLSGLLIWFLVFYQKKKLAQQLEKKDSLLREQQLIIEKQESIQHERNRIAAEMHDDLGSGLTTIRYLSDRALQKAGSEEERTQIGRIASQSNALIRNMSEIIWALNVRYDTLDSLLAYLRRYAAEFLDEHQIVLSWNQSDLLENYQLSGEVRRNIHLTVKEALNNIVKHSGANSVEIHYSTEGDTAVLKIYDNGRGFIPDLISSDGNGLFNMENRMKSIHGCILIFHKQPGTEIVLQFPIK